MKKHAEHTILPTVIALTISIGALSTVFLNWQPVINLLGRQVPRMFRYGEAQTLDGASKPAKVWVNTRSGLYYCSDSALFAKIAPGVIMQQDGALQAGFRPALTKICH